jgi:hypothetical protein
MLLKILPFLFLFVSCGTSYSYRKPPIANHAKEINEKMKVTLIGFCPYSVSSTSSVSGRVRTTRTTALLVTSYCAKDKFEFGTPIEKQVFTTTRTDVPEQVSKDFVKDYLNETKGSGVNELNPILKEDNKKLLLRKSDSDYYVVGIVQPPFGAKQSPMGMLTSFLTVFPAIGTLGTIPFVNQKLSTTRIRVYDKDFKFLKQYNYEDQAFWTITAWWTLWSSNVEHQVVLQKLSHPKGAMGADIKEFTNDFFEDHNTNKLTLAK